MENPPDDESKKSKQQQPAEERNRRDPKPRRARGRQYNDERQTHHHKDNVPANFGRPNVFDRSKDGPPSSSLNPEAKVFVPLNIAQTNSVEWVPKSDAGNNETLRERLMHELDEEEYECMICHEKIKRAHHVWACDQCFHVFHFHRNEQVSCISKWARRSRDENGAWRCPGCQNVNDAVPREYVCFCGKTRHPRARFGLDCAHTCGQVCGKVRGGGCPHKCTLPCHPGPCPVCPRHITKNCLCGAEKRSVRCGSGQDFQCSKVCDRVLNCELHKCEAVCHKGSCSPCDKTVLQDCFCGGSSREVECTVENLSTDLYSCGERCPKLYACSKHQCERPCHDGACGPCPLAPTELTRCACGKTKVDRLLDTPRTDCSDPVPLCGQICDKQFVCGPTDRPHRCESKCHTAACPLCTLSTPIRCRCGASTKSVSCAQRLQYDDDHPLLCERRCKKLRSCKQHKCNQNCCVDRDHLCMQICAKKLSCGLHTCDRLCHSGRCPPCLQASFEELHCECGASVLEPPVACGAKPPSCDQPCGREHDCSHSVGHRCHSEPECPPCTYLTKKWCYGKHELRTNIPCHLLDVSCGKPCSNELSCGQHRCIKSCHPGKCLASNEACRQPCPKPRKECDHTCAAPCHPGEPCPQTTCRAVIAVTCKCGRKNERLACSEVDRLWTRQMAVGTAQAMTDKSADVSNLNRHESVEKYRCLNCDGDCARVNRNRVLADAFGMDDADLIGYLHNDPTYTDFLKSMCKSNPGFITSIEKSLIELVQQAEKSKTSNVRSTAFAPMIREQRRAVHEYAQYFLIDTNSFDPEPQRNVVGTAKRGRSHVPSILLSSLIPRDNRAVARVAPPPINAWGTQNNKAAPSGSGEMQALGSSSAAAVVRRSPPPMRSRLDDD